MPRKNFIPQSEFPYHVTARCINKEWFKIPLDEVWDICSIYLCFIRFAFNVRIINFVLMSNHFHMLISTPEANLDKVMNYFMRETSRAIGKRAGRINQVYGGPYGWSMINTPIYFLHAYKYVYRNPTEVGLAEFVEDYRYSTINQLLGFTHGIIPLEFDETLFSDVRQCLSWLNTPYPSEEMKDQVRKALKKHQFGFAKDTSGNPSELEMKLI